MNTKRVAYAMVAGIVAASGYLATLTTSPAAAAVTPTVTTVHSTDLAIAASGPASTSTSPDSQVSIAVHVVNNGPDPTSQGTIVITTTLPAGVVLASGTGGGFGCTSSGQAVTCSHAAPLASGSALDMTLVLTITDPNLRTFNLLL